MKKNIILFIASFLWCTALVAQDVIVRKDGSTIISKVLEVNQSDVKYKKHSNLNGPTYTINKSDILSINYENGEKEKYDNDSAPIVAESKQVSGGVAKPESDNQSVIKICIKIVTNEHPLHLEFVTPCNIQKTPPFRKELEA